MSFAVRFATTLGRAMERSGPRIARVMRAVRRPFRFKPKLKSIPLSDLQKVMPRMFRRGYGVGGMLRRRRRRAGGRRIYRKKTQNKVHTFVRWCDKDTLYGEKGPSQIVETSTNQHLAYQFKLDNVVNPSDFTNLYDSYRINKIQLFLEPTADQANGANVSHPVSKKVRVVHDYNDANPLTDEDQYLEYANCKSYFPFSKRGIKITLYPKINNVIENAGGAASAYTSMNSNRVWLNIANDEVSHFGIKIFIPDGLLPIGGVVFNVRAKYWLSMKSSK